MAKVWVNPDFKETFTTGKKEDKNVKNKSKINTKEDRNKVIKKVKCNPSEEYLIKHIKARRKLKIKFIDNEIIEGAIQWADQRYIKVETEKEGLLIEKRAIKYIRPSS